MHGNLSPQSEPDITECWRPAIGRSRAKTRSRNPLYLDIGTGLDAGIKRNGLLTAQLFRFVPNASFDEMAKAYSDAFFRVKQRLSRAEKGFGGGPGGIIGMKDAAHAGLMEPPLHLPQPTAQLLRIADQPLLAEARCPPLSGGQKPHD